MTHSATLRAYDFVGPGSAVAITTEEVVRTRVSRSRISAAEVDWFVARSATCDALWLAVGPGARLADADANVHGDLYDRALALFEHFSEPARVGVSTGKISKVLHLKRPNLFPILDTELRHAYQPRAEEAARRLQPQRPGLRAAYWAAIRADLLDPANVAGLAVLRRRLREHDRDMLRRVADLSDVRLLDIIAWRPRRRG